MIYHGRVIGPGGQVYWCEHNHRTQTAAITCANSSATRRMAAMVWQRAAAQAAREAALAKQRAEEREAARARRIAAQEAAEARRAAARAAREQARADKRAARLAGMSPKRAWKHMTPEERLLRTADLEMQSYGEIRSPDALAAYQARAAKPTTPEAPASSTSTQWADFYIATTHSGDGTKALEQHKVQAKKPSGQGATRGLLVILAILVVIIAVLVHLATSGPSGPALTIMKKIPGCTNITTNGGNSLDDNTVSEGSCQLPDGTNVNVYVWFSGDITEQHDYVYQNSSNCAASSSSLFPPDGCFVGSNPQPWFIDVATSSGTFSTSSAESDWVPIENGLVPIQVTNVPLSWCSTTCPIPGEPSGGGGFSFGDGD